MGDDRFDDPVFEDALFRQKRKHGRYRVVAPPRLERPAVDTHAHVHLLPDPALAFAQCTVHGVAFVCDVVDVCEDDPAVFDRFEGWLAQTLQMAPQLVQASRELVEAQGDELTRLPQGAAAEELLPAACTDAPRDGGAACADASPAARLSAPRLRLAVGCHPHNARLFDDAAERQLRARLADARVCAVGEIGLDYHYDFSPREAQREAFRRQIRIAHETGLPVALHIREAHDEAFAILNEEGFPPAGTLLHCFDLDWDTLAPWMEAGCFVAVGGAVTFARCGDTREALRRVPLDRLLTETDSPYMAPEPMRGVVCTPAHVVFAAARVAEVLGCAAGEERAALLERLANNARGLLDRPPTLWQRARAAGSAPRAEAVAPQEVAVPQAAAAPPAAGPNGEVRP